MQNQVRELHRLLGKKTLEAELLKEALEHATGSKNQPRRPAVAAKGWFPMKPAAEVIGVSRFAFRSRKAIGVGAPTASRSAATTDAQESRDAADRKARAIVDDLRTARMNTAAMYSELQIRKY